MGQEAVYNIASAEGIYPVCEIPSIGTELQWSELHKRGDIPGELRLLAAALQDAIWLVTRPPKSRNGAKRGQERHASIEAYQWIFGEEDPDYVLSFANVCEVFGLAPSAVRREIRKMIETGSCPILGRQGKVKTRPVRAA